MSFTPYPNEVYTIFSFIGFIISIIPLPWHLKTWNVGTCLYMFWTAIGCFIFFINSIVWHGNAYNSAPIWCDICSKILVGAGIGIPAASLCINRRLYLLQLNATGRPDATKSEKMRILAVDLGITVGLPILIMILHYIPQGHRFDIYEDIGCYMTAYNTWVAIFIMAAPPVLVGLVSATYGIRTIISINKRRKDFNALLASQLNVTASLYIRLMCLAGVEALLTVPLAGFFFVFNLTLAHVYPWISWEDTHSNFNRADQYPAIVWHEFPSARVLEFVRWIYVICAILFFAFFGFAEEARFHYRLAAKFFLKLIGVRLGHRREIPISFQTGPISRPDLAGRLTFASKGRHRADSFYTVSAYPCSETGESPSGTTLCDTQDYSHDRSGSPAPTCPTLRSPSDLDVAPRAFIDEKTQGESPLNTHIPVPLEQEDRRRPSISSRITQNLRSFLNLDHDEPSIKHASSAYSPQTDISTVEEGQPSKARRPSNRLSRHFRSFLSFN